MAWPARLLLAGILIGLRQDAAAHDLFTNYVQHSVHLTVGARYLDLTLELTFFEEWSARERQTMDADANGNITRAERESYLKKRAPQLSRQLKLRVAGRELPLVSLYDPEMDLLGNEKVGPGHHRLRLFFFAPTPTSLRAGDEIVVEDGLWPDAKVLGTVQVEGRNGCVLTTEISAHAGLASAQLDETRRFKFRCLKPPLANAAASKAPSYSSRIPSPRPPIRSQHLPAPKTQTVP